MARKLVPFIASSDCPAAIERMVNRMQQYMADHKKLKPILRNDLLNLASGAGFVEVDDLSEKTKN